MGVKVDEKFGVTDRGYRYDEQLQREGLRCIGHLSGGKSTERREQWGCLGAAQLCTQGRSDKLPLPL